MTKVLIVLRLVKYYTLRCCQIGIYSTLNNLRTMIIEYVTVGGHFHDGFAHSEGHGDGYVQ